ncbi:hypothetical protein H2200_001558 [Cladophialophora chaetospira]|uniref:Cytochrome P450 n=1 Tax=Cladophialophora chaetospira TaxID=386627 RepID=A0AA38XL82_9EURO|nr:hypothetical protein H2200_001558 [Cladophialophora chaetospira]
MANVSDQDRGDSGSSTLQDAFRRLFTTSSRLQFMYTISDAVLFASLLQRVLFKQKKYKLFPGWAAIEIALTGYVISRGGLSRQIYSAIRRRGGSLFGLTSTHQVLINLPDVDRVMSQAHHTLSTEPLQYTLTTRVFGATDTPELKQKFEDCAKDLLKPVAQVFSNDANAAAALEKSCIPKKAASFVTFSSDVEKMKRWELSAGTRVITPDSLGKPGAVEANLQSLSRDFGACIAVSQLYGKDFLARNEKLLDDFWTFDNDLFPLMLVGIPIWAPFKIVRDGVAARSRLNQALEGLYRRIDQFQKGQAVDFGADLSDISSVALGRNMVYNRHNWSFKDRGGGDLALLWGQNANTQPLLFWFLVYVYSTLGLLARIREEIAPYVPISKSASPEIASIDLPALSHDCVLTKACLFETYRLANEAASIRYVARPITVNDGDLKHELKPGTFVSAPHSLIQRDPLVYADPDRFIPDRFVEVDPESGKLVARYGRLKPWGSGTAQCKGRPFAEKEILMLGSAIISLWNIAPAGGTWKLPAMVPGTGVEKPVEDIRVVITRRVF